MSEENEELKQCIFSSFSTKRQALSFLLTIISLKPLSYVAKLMFLRLFDCAFLSENNE